MSIRLLIWGVGNIGKTSVGRLLAKELNVKFYDVDEDFIIKKLYMHRFLSVLVFK